MGKLRKYYATVQADVQDSYYYANQVWFFVKITVSGAREKKSEGDKPLVLRGERVLSGSGLMLSK